MAKLQDWIDTAKAEFDMTAKDARRLRRISKQLLAYELLACNERNLTDTEAANERELVSEVKEICDRYEIKASDGDSIGYEFPDSLPDSRSNSGLRFVLPSGKGVYNL